MNKVLIQKQNGNFLAINQYLSHYGFTRMGYDVKTFEVQDVSDMEFDKDTIVHGGIKTTHMIFDKLGIPRPPVHNPQDYLPKYCGNRNLREMTLREASEFVRNNRGKSLFLKPAHSNKLFTGFVAHNVYDFMRLNQTPKDTIVLVSDVIDIQAEFRCYVFNGKLVGAKNYTGDFTVLPDFDIINNAIKDYKEAPVAYSLDFAIVADSLDTSLIEINDMYCLSNYGINAVLYCRMLEARWREITK